MNLVKILLVIIIFVVIIKIIYDLNKPTIAEYIVCKIFKNFTIGNFELIDVNNGNTIIKVTNDKYDYITKVYIENKEIFFTSIFNNHEIGLGETYMDGYWYSNNLFSFLLILVLNQNNINVPNFENINIYNKNLSYDKKNIEHHYNIGNDFYEKFMTDKLFAYTCGFFDDEYTTLEEAQFKKVNIIIKKLGITPGSNVLDIGCGWGRIANYVAETTNSHVTGLTISEEQFLFAKNNYDEKKVSVIIKDYRKMNMKFDFIYCIGMIEHVRYENYDDYFQTIKRCLKPNGRFLLHTIIGTVSQSPNTVIESFVQKHIFPGGQIPNNDWIMSKLQKNNLKVIHSEFFGGQHYARTLNIWNKNLLENKDYIIDKYSIQQLRMFEYYFNICEACFTNDDWGIGHYLIINNDYVDLDNNFMY